jgi:fatty-acyl-CoA synthase
MNRLFDWIDQHNTNIPHQTALRFEGRDISYGSFAAEVSRYAQTLKQTYGVEPGDRVAFLGLNSPVFLYLLFACARLGAVFLPLNWRLAPPELHYILSDAAVKILICDADQFAAGKSIKPGLLAELPSCRFVTSEARATDGPGDWQYLAEDVACASGADCFDNLNADMPVLLMYTSGTTGHPKGVVINHETILAQISMAMHLHDMTAADHVLTPLPMFHIGSLNLHTLASFYCGATLTLLRRFDPAQALAILSDDGITLVAMVPAALTAMIDSPEWAAADLSGLRAFASGGSTVPTPVIEQARAKAFPLCQSYGTTETGAVTTGLSPRDAYRQIGSIGKAGLNCQIRIAGQDGAAVPEGEAGEILVKGPNLFSGYWRNEEATREALRDGWYHTGDIGRQDAAGYVYILGREKDMVISGGENIYPAEIELLLIKMADVADAVVVGRADEKWGEVPVAVVVPEAGATIDAADFLNRFDGQLARFKQPKDVLIVDKLPRNAMGKVLKQQVREMVSAP